MSTRDVKRRYGYGWTEEYVDFFRGLAPEDRQYLYDFVNMYLSEVRNSKNFAVLRQKARNDAKIRDGSAYYVYISDLDIYMLNLVIDIES